VSADVSALGNRELIHLYWQALTTGHAEDLAPLVFENAVFHYPGNHYLSGDYHGKAAIVGLYANLIKINNSRFEGTLHDVAVGETFTVAALSYRLHLLPKRSLPGRACGLFRIIDGKIHEYWLFEWDQAMMNDVFRTAGVGWLWRHRGVLAALALLPRWLPAVLRTTARLYGRYTAPTEV
jgi:ketosteroid isomerase-like protein